MRDLPRAFFLLHLCASALGFGTRSADWKVAPTGISGCEAGPESCTALLPWQVGFDTRGVVLTLSQRRCFGSDGTNDPTCCSGSRQCAAWAGAAVETVEPFEYGVLEVMATLVDAAAVARVDSALPLSIGTHRYTAMRSGTWLATAVDGVIVSNVTDDAGVQRDKRGNLKMRQITNPCPDPAGGPVRIGLVTATGSSPILTFECSPPGAPTGRPASFVIGAGRVAYAGETLFANTISRATVTIPQAEWGSCSPCPVAESPIAQVFTQNISGTVKFAADVTLIVSSVSLRDLTTAAIRAATTPTAADKAAASKAASMEADAIAAQLAADQSAAMAQAARIRDVQTATSAAASVFAAQLVLESPTLPPAPPVPSPSAPPPATPPSEAKVFALTGLGSSVSTYVGSFAIGVNAPYSSDAQVSSAMSAASGLSISATMTYGTVVTIVQSRNDASRHAGDMARAFRLDHVSFHVESATKAVYILPIQVSNLDVAEAISTMRTVDVFATAAKCISIYSTGEAPTNIASIIRAIGAAPIATSTDDVTVRVADEESVSGDQYNVMYTLGGIAALVVAAALIVCVIERSVRDGTPIPVQTKRDGVAVRQKSEYERRAQYDVYPSHSSFGSRKSFGKKLTL